MSDAREETQQDRCSAQLHLWRLSTFVGTPLMRCQCGAVHPDDLDEFMSLYREATAPA